VSATLDRTPRFVVTLPLWSVIGVAALLLGAAFSDPIMQLLNNWLTRPEYSHGVVIPALSAYLVWQRSDVLARTPFTGSWLGFLVAVAGVTIWLAGELSTIYAVTQFALLIVIAGAVLALAGNAGFRILFVPVALLALTIPLPRFIYNNFSSELQLISSQLGVAILRLFDVSVYLEGNVIDLGHFQMQVVEACDGLRYLFPMMALGLVVAYFFRGPFWQRALIFLSSIPITIGMNSLRIAVIGLFAERGNTALAEGILHDLQGWAMFMLSTVILLLFVRLILSLGSRGMRFADVFDLGGGPAATPNRSSQPRAVPLPFILTTLLLGFSATAAFALPQRPEVQPSREFCATFPMRFEEFRGQREPLETVYLDALKMSDYVMANYRGPDSGVINLFLAYYDSQRKGESVHSPRSCLPGGGWKIQSFDTHAVASQPDFRVNRAVIAMGEQKQLVYYWFKQRDRAVTSEFAVKWYIFIDSLFRNRSDGALVRLVTPVPEGESLQAADSRLGRFADLIRGELARYVPD